MNEGIFRKLRRELSIPQGDLRRGIVWFLGGLFPVLWLVGEVFFLLTDRREIWQEQTVELLWRGAVLVLLLLHGRLLSRLLTRSEPGLAGARPDHGGSGEGRSTGVIAEEKTTGAPTAEADPLEWAFRLVSARLQALERRWQQEERQPTSRPQATTGREQAATVAQAAEDLANIFRVTGEPDSAARNLAEIASRLRTAIAASEGAAEEMSFLLPSLQTPAEWRSRGGAEPLEYLRYLLDSERCARDSLEAVRSRQGSQQEIDWRGPAEALLPLAGSRRPREGEPDPHGFQRLHAALLDLLGYEEISVKVDDSIDRDIHIVESVRATKEHRPNRVIEVIAPGYRDRQSKKVWRKAVVVLSEQHLG